MAQPLTKEQLNLIINDASSTKQQVGQATSLLAAMEPSTGEFNYAEMWASYARSLRDPARRAQMFKDFREDYKNDPVAFASFAPEREHLRAKRGVYDLDGGDIIGYAFDEDIPQLLAEKGRGYYGTTAYFIERRGMSQEAAELAASEHRERVTQREVL
jgi:hypothetical protein